MVEVCHHRAAVPAKTREAVIEAVRAGLSPLQPVPNIRLADWAAENFVLAGDSSHARGRWDLWPFQVGLLDWMADDSIEELDVLKSKRVGYTKGLAAFIAYNAAHRHRNQAIWQPTDDDRDSFVATEIDPILEAIKPVRDARRSTKGAKDRVGLKRFRHSVSHFLGGKAARAYRRITVAVVMLDELDGFDLEIEKAGDPVTLAQGRLEGAPFPKTVCGSTPRVKGTSHIEHRANLAAVDMRYCIACPHCGVEHPLIFGDAKVRHGLKWDKDDPDSVRHVCPHCLEAISQGDYLANWRGVWVCERTGVRYGEDRVWRSAEGQAIKPPRHVACHLWAAYSPQRSWASIVREHGAAYLKKKAGDSGPMKVFCNETLGRPWEEEYERTDVQELKARAEGYPLRLVPRGGLILCAGVDVQDNRFVIVVWAFGRDDEMWVVDDRVMYCDPGSWQSWIELDAYLATRFPHAGGQTMAIDAVAIDTGGHFTHQVYRYVMRRESRRVHAVHGSSMPGKPIVAGAPRKVDVNADGQVIKSGVSLWQVGTDTAKDLLHSRLAIAHPGPGYIHLSSGLPDEFYSELVAEVRVEQKVAHSTVTRWVKPNSSVRNERLDCTVYALFAAARMKLHQYTDAEWRRLELALFPPTADLWSPPVPVPLPEPPSVESQPPPAAASDLDGSSTAEGGLLGPRRRRVLSRGIV